MKRGRFLVTRTLTMAAGLAISGRHATADLLQYWPLDDGGASATAANLAVGGNVGMLSAGGVPESWNTTDLHMPLTTRSSDPSTAALRLDGSFVEFMDGGDLGLNSTLWVEGEPQPAGGQATISMWIKPVNLFGDDRLFSQTGNTDCCTSGIGGSARIFSGGELQVWTNDTPEWESMAAADAPENTVVVDAWQHLTYVWNYGSVKSYLNGVPTAQFDDEPVYANFSYDSAGSGTDQNFGLGSRFHTSDLFFGNSFDGLVDDLAIWDVALKPDRVALLAGGTSPRDIDDSDPETPFVFVPPPPPPAPPAGRLTHYWPLDETLGATAASGLPTGNQGTLINFDDSKLNNAAQSPPGDWTQSDVPSQLAHSTGALDFEGQETNIPGGNFVLGGDIGLTSDGEGGGATVSLWLKPRSLPAGDGTRLFGQAGEAVACCGHLTTPAGALRVMDDGSIDVWSGGAWNDLADPAAVAVGEWHHLAFVWGGSEVTAYVDGTEMLTAAANFNFDATIDPNQEFGLGRIFNDGFGITPDAIFDDVSIWDGVLNPMQISALASGTSPLDIVPVVPGDFNGDGVTDGLDFLVWQQGGSPDPGSSGDLTQWAANFGTNAGSIAGSSAANVSVPEPNTWLLLLAAEWVFVTKLANRGSALPR